MECVVTVFSPPLTGASRPTCDKCDLFLWVLRLKGILLNESLSGFGITSSSNPADSPLSTQSATPINWVIFPWALSRGTPRTYPPSAWILCKFSSCTADGRSPPDITVNRVTFSVSFPWIIWVLGPWLICFLSPVVKCTVAPEFAWVHGITSGELSSSESICCLLVGRTLRFKELPKVRYPSSAPSLFGFGGVSTMSPEVCGINESWPELSTIPHSSWVSTPNSLFTPSLQTVYIKFQKLCGFCLSSSCIHGKYFQV